MISVNSKRVDLNLTGKTALVCGASRGIGAAAARAFAAQGARVLALARNEDDLVRLVEQLDGEGHRALAVDFNDLGKMDLLLSSELAKGPIEILVNNSGGPKGGPILNAEDSEFTNAFRQHVLVNSHLAKLLIPGMKSKNYGRIINVISTSVKMPIPGLGVSNTIRAAVASWAKTLAGEVAPFGITVNSVLPGFTKTERLESLLKSASEVKKMTVEQVATEWRAATPMGRFGEPEEIAAAIAFFASPAAGFITGTALQVDGGRTSAL